MRIERCPACTWEINSLAKRCPHCTSELGREFRSQPGATILGVGAIIGNVGKVFGGAIGLGVVASLPFYALLKEGPVLSGIIGVAAVGALLFMCSVYYYLGATRFYIR
uniref:Uncharacterized protein n=1 Tax=Bosea sp. NBC_00436 TaxID=2969620 RepID=A0A9E8A378_9HYPH